MKYIIILGLVTVLAGCGLLVDVSVRFLPPPSSEKICGIESQQRGQWSRTSCPWCRRTSSTTASPRKRGVSTRTDPKGCEFTMTYAVERWWDFKPYMVDAQMTVNKDDEAYIGEARTIT